MGACVRAGCGVRREGALWRLLRMDRREEEEEAVVCSVVARRADGRKSGERVVCRQDFTFRGQTERAVALDVGRER